MLIATPAGSWSRPGVATAPYQAFVVSQQLTESFSTASHDYIASEETGGLVAGPNSIVASPDGRYVYIADSADILKVDTGDDSSAVLPAGGAAYGLALEGNDLYVTHGPSNSYSVVNVSAGTVGQAVTVPGSAYGIAATGSDLFIDLVDPSNYVILARFPVGSGMPDCTSMEGSDNVLNGTKGSSWAAESLEVQTVDAGSEILTNSPGANGEPVNGAIWAFGASCATNPDVEGSFLPFVGACPGSGGLYGGMGFAVSGSDVYAADGSGIVEGPLSRFGECQGQAPAAVATLPEDLNLISSLAISPDGSSIWVAGTSETPLQGVAYAVDSSSGMVTGTFPRSAYSFGVAIAPGPQPPSPEVDSVAPKSGPEAGGTHITVTGKHLLGATSVSFVLSDDKHAAAKSFDCENASCSVVTPNVVSLLPANGTAEAPSDVTVTTADGTSGKSSDDRFTFIRSLHVDSLNPVQAGPHGGIPIVVTGQGFGSRGSDDQVAFIPASGAITWGTKVDVVSDNAIVVTIPAESAAIADNHNHATVKVRVGTRFSNAVPFSYGIHITSVTPGVAGAHGGMPLTIIGRGFGPAGSEDDVSFSAAKRGVGARPTHLRVVSDTKITGTVPAESTGISDSDDRAEVSVDVDDLAGGVFSNEIPFTYGIHVGSIKPASAGPHGGVKLVITGRGFGPVGSDDHAYFLAAKRGVGAEISNVRVVSDTEITGIVPDESTGASDSGNRANVEVEEDVEGRPLDPLSSNEVPFQYRIHITSIKPTKSATAGDVPLVITGVGFGPPGSDASVLFIAAKRGNGATVHDVKVVSDTEITGTVPPKTSGIAASGNLAEVEVDEDVAGRDLDPVVSNQVPFTYTK